MSLFKVEIIVGCWEVLLVVLTFCGDLLSFGEVLQEVQLRHEKIATGKG